MSSREKRNQITESLVVVGRVFIVIAILVIFGSFYDHLEKDHEQIVQAFWGYRSLSLVEAKHPLGWAWFNKDAITFGQEGFTIDKKTLFMEKKIQVPYSKVKKIAFEEGAFINTMTVQYDAGGLFGSKNSFYLRKRESFETLKVYCYGISGSFPFVEDASIMKSIGRYLNKKERRPT